MDREPIYLEKDDEITSVVDKLKSARGIILDIVIPKEAIMLQSVINLKLLKRQAEALGKEITIVTQDKVGTKLAEQIGIPVVAKEGQTPKEVSISESEKPEYSEEDIEMVEKEKPSEEESDSAIKKVKDEPADENPKKAKKSGGWLKRHWRGALLAGGFGLIALAVAAYIFVPLANIQIRLAAENKKVDISFTADKTAESPDAAAGLIPAREIAEELEKTETIKATGEKDVGEKASGKVKICNKEDSDSFTLAAGSRLLDSSNLVYKTQTNVLVPGASVSGGTALEECSVEVLIKADLAGEKYNKSSVGVGFSLPALTGQYRAESTTEISGGSSRKVKYVTAGDVASAKDSVAKAVESEIEGKINEGIQGEILLEGAMETKVLSSSSSVSVGSETEEFKYTVKAKSIALLISEENLKSLAEERLRQEIGSTKEIVEADSLITSTKLTKIDTELGKFEAVLAGEAYIATRIVEEDLRNSINGDPEAVAIDYLNQIEGIESVEIKFFPSFYKRVPRINSHIYFKTEISKTQTE
ncbi:MAG: hypothetical protein PHT36_02930 [Patescibacteria group bacterium]|nr:hypothetical protein [Patescibacteria group bacterium]